MIRGEKRGVERRSARRAAKQAKLISYETAVVG
jgi:hypothetical protein